MKYIIHPDNLPILKKQLDVIHKDANFPLFGIEIVTDAYVEKERWTGKWILPDNRVVETKDIRIPNGPFFEWDGDDVIALEWWGLIRKQMEMNIVQINDSILSRMWDKLEMIYQPKFFVGHCI